MGGLIRRRGLILPSGGDIDCPYITDGLIFWLDGINRGGVTGEWKDLIQGKTFTLINATESEKGVKFSSSGYGSCNGAISSNWQTETIEIAVDPIGLGNKCFLCPSRGTGIGLVTANGASTFSINMDGVSGKKWNSESNIYLIGANNSHSVTDGTSYAQGVNDTWSANQSDYTYLGARYTTTFSRYSSANFHSVRIYNRQLTVEEMMSNQAVDRARFNL